MRFHVRESHGKYFLADEQWSRMYTMGALAVPEPVASFSRKEDAEAFLALKNRNGPTRGHYQDCSGVPKRLPVCNRL